MKFGIRGGRIVLTEALLAHVERRLRLILTQFGQRIKQVAVRLTELHAQHLSLRET